MARAEVARVVGVDPVGDGAEAELVAQLAEHLEEFRLAVVTAVRVVRAVGVALHFVRLDEAVRDREARDDLLCHAPVVLGIGSRHGGHRERVGAERLARGVGEVAGVDAARERHQHTTGAAQSLAQRGVLGSEISRNAGHESEGKSALGTGQPSAARAAIQPV
ncbi:MAG: hypothetical protein H6Q91_1950 [Deltaproteobacteria bacterium]|nr:hypothetical protein [Deltaproteobacteria bacterium]